MTDLAPLPPTAAEVERHWTKADFRTPHRRTERHVTTTEIPETPYVETEALLAVMNEDEDVTDILSGMNPSEVHDLGQAANRLYRLCAVEYALRRQRAFAAGHPLPPPQWGI